MNAVVPHGQEFRQSTDAASLCGAIVKQTAKNIQGRRFVSVEGWQAIAIAHGCAAGSRDVEKVDGGVRAIGEVRRMDDGQLIATAEGFVGEDEPTWYGGQMRGKTLPKRADYAIRAMAQTRAISRACRSAFAHVVVMIDAGLSTTPAEEVPDGGFVEGQFQEASRTGEPHEPANPTPEPENRKNWGGRYPTKTALRKARTIHHAEMERIGVEGTFDDLDAYLTSPEYQDYIKIAGEHFPLWLDGEIPPEMAEAMPPEYIQTFRMEQKARDMIAVRGNVPAEPA